VVAEELLDNPAGLEAADPGGMLPAVASAAAQVREAAAFTVEAGLSRLSGEDLPR
jgi:glucose/mannose-6-phosphate isomerase